MKHIIYILIVLFITSCLEKPQSKYQTTGESHKTDSLALMYKERGNIKSDAGDKQGAINDFLKQLSLRVIMIQHTIIEEMENQD